MTIEEKQAYQILNDENSHPALRQDSFGVLERLGWTHECLEDWGDMPERGNAVIYDHIYKGFATDYYALVAPSVIFWANRYGVVKWRYR